MSDKVPEFSAETSLAIYGTLAPGGVNHDKISDLKGEWVSGVVKGRLIKKGWGAHLGCPGIVLDPEAGDVEVKVFRSLELPDHWERLDAFEGADYRRVTIEVKTASGKIEASIYEVISETGV